MSVGRIDNYNYNSYYGSTGRISPRLSKDISPEDTQKQPSVGFPQKPGALVFNDDGDSVQISDRARSLSLDALEPQKECQTCKNRRYIDKSDDASVSYQTPTNISPSMAAAAVSAHENEHVRNEKARAQREGHEIVNQTVTLTYDTCPECGKHYVSGGTTRTTTVSKPDSEDSAEKAYEQYLPGKDTNAA